VHEHGGMCVTTGFSGYDVKLHEELAWKAKSADLVMSTHSEI
jgi:hypothetical protein